MAGMSQEDSIRDDSAYFKRMLDLIPPQSYFDAATKEQLIAQNYTTKGSTDGHDEQDKRQKHKNKQKRRLENPLLTKSVSQLQEDLAMKESSSGTSEFTGIKAKKQKMDSSSKAANPLTAVSMDLDDKRLRLRARIEELQAKRKLNDSEKIQKRRLQRKESKMKLNKKRKLLKEGKQNLAQNAIPKSNEVNRTPNKSPGTPGKPIFNKEGQMVFSKFDFTDSTKKEKHKNEFRGKDYKRLLEKVEKRNEKINKKRGEDETAGKMLVDKHKWKTALLKTEGEKVKDNPELLKKSLKRKEKMKEKRKKKWLDRESTVKKQQDAKHEKRTKNIQARKQNKKDNKLKKAKKKGRIIPGF